MKEEPYKVTKIHESEKVYTIEELYKTFENYIKKEEEINVKFESDVKLHRNYQEVNRLDFKDIIIRAFNSVGRSCEFD
jgi:hypothetical protein